MKRVVGVYEMVRVVGSIIVGLIHINSAWWAHASNVCSISCLSRRVSGGTMGVPAGGHLVTYKPVLNSRINAVSPYNILSTGG